MTDIAQSAEPAAGPPPLDTTMRRTAPPTSSSSLVGSAVIWVALLCIGVASLVPIFRAASDELSGYALVNADEATIRAHLVGEWPAGASADYLETLSELGLMLEPAEPELAYLAAQRTLAKDPDRPFAWATLAYLEVERAGPATKEAVEAIRNSMDACGLCRTDLVRWRLNFVLTHWNAMPDELRRRAFEHADLLRWTGNNGEFLAEMRFKAMQAGIPFDTYRSEVNTPVRSWDIGPAPNSEES